MQMLLWHTMWSVGLTCQMIESFEDVHWSFVATCVASATFCCGFHILLLFLRRSAMHDEREGATAIFCTAYPVRVFFAFLFYWIACRIELIFPLHAPCLSLAFVWCKVTHARQGLGVGSCPGHGHMYLCTHRCTVLTSVSFCVKARRAGPVWSITR